MPASVVTAYFDISPTGGAFFTLDDPVKGKLDNVTYGLGGALGSDISQYVEGYTVNRGRMRRLDQIVAGVATMQAVNMTKLFDPEYAPGPFFGELLPGRRVTFQAAGVVIYDGSIDDWGFVYDDTNTGISTVSIDVSDALAVLGGESFTAWTGTAGETPGARLADVLNRPEVAFPIGQRNLDAGTSTLQGDAITFGTNVLNYCQTVAQSDFGQLFASRDNTLTFYGRNRAVTGVGAPVFANDGVGIPYADLTRAQVTDLLYNVVGVQTVGGVAQVASDATSQQTYGIRTLPITGLLMDSDDQALDMANYLLSIYKAPDPRIATVTVQVHALALADQRTVLSLDLGSIVRVKYTPTGGTLIDHFCLVEGIAHTVGPRNFTTVLSFSNLAAGFSGTPFVLDSTEFGVLDQNVLGFGSGSGSSTVGVGLVTDIGEGLVTDSGEPIVT